MMELTKEEQIQAIYDLKVGYTLGHADIAMLKSMARQLLAGLEQEPVAQVYQPANIGICAPLGPSVMMLKPLSPGTKLYAAPQLPQPAVVSGEMIDTFEEGFRRAFEVSDGVEQLIEIGYQGEKFSLSIRDAATWWKLGRAAMLQGAETVSQSNTLPKEINCKQAYCMMHSNSLAGCYRDGWNDCRTVMLEAAPQQEVATDNTTQQFESLGLIVTSDERKMEVPHCSKHPETELLVHPLDQLMSYPPQPVMYCPLCKPSVAEWARRQRDGK